VIITILKEMDKTGTRFVLDRVMEMFPEVPSVLQSGDASAPSPGSSSSLLLSSLESSDTQVYEP